MFESIEGGRLAGIGGSGNPMIVCGRSVDEDMVEYSDARADAVLPGSELVLLIADASLLSGREKL